MSRWEIAGRVLATAAFVVLAVAAAALCTLLVRGVSARDRPTRPEVALARVLRHFAVPAAMRKMPNPLPLNAQVLADGRAHWADHCAGCHGNDGSGRTEIGQALYPKAPDMRGDETQKLSDGELYAIIRNGVRLTGMPGWGGQGQADQDNWKLVHFIRHLPKLSTEEIRQMERLNPKTPDELEQARQEDEFLSGGPPPQHEH